MAVARAFVLSMNSRALLAVVLVASSVAYAVVTGTAVHGLQDASALSGQLAQPDRVVLRSDGAPFDASALPDGSVALASSTLHGIVLGTQRPWPYPEETVAGPYARLPADAQAEYGVPAGGALGDGPAPGDWVLVPPDRFDALVPALAGKAAFAVVPAAASLPAALGTGPGAAPSVLPGPAAGQFYADGAGQVFAGVQLVVLGMGVVVAVFSGGVLRLEVLARERDLATLEALGGRQAARRAVVLRALLLVGLGVGAGLAAGLAFARLAGRTLGPTAGRMDLALAAEAALLALAAGLLAGAWGGLARLRAPLAQRLGRRGPSPRPFRGPVRFLLVTPRLAPSAFAAALVLSSVTTVVLAAAALPYEAFHPADDQVVVGQAQGDPFRGSADRFLGEHLTLFPGIEASNPETVAPTVLRGGPVVVRGVLPGAWQQLDHPALLAGRWPSAPGEATAGERAARLLGLQPGDVVRVPGAYRPTVRALAVTGIHAGAGLLDDELVTDLDTAGDLAGLPPDLVHFVRVRGTAEAVQAALLAEPLRAVNLTVEPPQPAPFTVATARVALVNVGAEPRTRTLALRVDGIVEDSRTVQVAPHSEAEADIPFLVPPGPDLQLQVNPTADVTTAPAALQVLAPATVAANGTFAVRVQSADGVALPGVAVQAGAARATTNATGDAALPAGPPARLPVRASAGGLSGGAVVFVVEPSWALSAHVQAERAVVTGAGTVNGTGARYDLAVAVVNLGAAPFQGIVEARANGTLAGDATLALAPRAEATVNLTAVVPRGTRALDVAGLAVTLPDPGSAATPPDERPRSVEEVIAGLRANAERARAAQELHGSSFLARAFATLAPSIAVVLLATFLHAGAGVAVAVVREVRERGEVRATLQDLGAGPDQLALRAARDALLAALPAMAAGAGVAMLALSALRDRSFPAAFGHTVPVALDLGTYLRLVGALALVAMLAAAWAARTPAPAPARRVPPAPLPALLGAPR